jgi:hypothetical protein
LIIERIRPRATLPTRRRRATIAGMGSEHLTREQARKLVAQIERQTVYLQKMVDQMRRLRWPEDDPLWNPTVRAHAAMMNLLMHARGAGFGDRR